MQKQRSKDVSMDMSGVNVKKICLLEFCLIFFLYFEAQETNIYDVFKH